MGGRGFTRRLSRKMGNMPGLIGFGVRYKYVNSPLLVITILPPSFLSARHTVTVSSFDHRCARLPPPALDGAPHVGGQRVAPTDREETLYASSTPDSPSTAAVLNRMLLSICHRYAPCSV